MVLPPLRQYADGQFAKAQATRSIVAFRGLNQGAVPAEGEFSEMANLSAQHFPCLSPRAPRSVWQSASDMSTFTFLSGKMACVRGNDFYFDGSRKGTLNSSLSGNERQLICFQKQVIIWPDRKRYDMATDRLEDMALSFSRSGLQFTASALDEALGDLVKYASIRATQAFSGFSAGDSVAISGCQSVEGNNKYAVIDHISSDQRTLYFADNTLANGTESGSVLLERKIPDMDYLCVSGNRLWGCKDSSIYGSKLGSADNWYCFAGISTDSYALELASAGRFSGCHVYGSYVVFFKEDAIHKLIGTKPSNFQLSTLNCPALGLEEGSQQSLAYIAGVLYFKAPLGVVNFMGGAPSLVSQALGNAQYRRAVAGTDGRLYYISMEQEGQSSLFVLDTLHGLWHREDSSRARAFGLNEGMLFMLSGGTVFRLGDHGGSEMVSWSGTLGEFWEQSADKKLHAKLRLRLSLEAGASCKLEYSADGADWRTAWEGSGSVQRSFFAALIPRRCDRLRLRLSGRGACRIYQIDRVFTAGSEW